MHLSRRDRLFPSIRGAGRANRREFMSAAVAAVGASSFLGTSGPLWGQGKRDGRIDIHHHLIAPEYRKAAEKAGFGTLPPLSPELSIAEMDKNGIALGMLSLASPGLWFGDRDQSRFLARAINDHGAKMVRDYRGRFGLLAALPLLDIEASLKEIAYAYDTLEADGVGLITSYEDRYLGDAVFAPVWEELNRRNAVVYTHPSWPSCCSKMQDGLNVSTVEYATDTTRTIGSIVFGGTAARYPNIRWIFSHGGGTLPFLVSRFEREEATLKNKQTILPRGLRGELRRFYYEIAQANHPGALDALLRLVSVTQVMFGTDYPYRPASEAVDGLAAYHFSSADLAAIERENALRLFPSKRDSR
jgi:predicted TIM-barrel fold metal-dependent hydrolase